MLTPTTINIGEYPDEFRPLLLGANIYDSSYSKEARVLFIDKDSGYYLKTARKGTLEREAAMTGYFHSKGLAAEVLAYISSEQDWMLTAKVRGDNALAAQYLEKPKRLCDILAERLAQLHAEDYSDCPIKNHTELYLAKAKENYLADTFNKTNYPDKSGADTMLMDYCKAQGYTTAKEAWSVLETCGNLLRTDTLLHGDYCLPNIILDDWRFSGFIDLDNSGVGDRHVDIFWGTWSLYYNLKSDKYRDRFIDAYGRDKVDIDILHIITAAEVFG